MIQCPRCGIVSYNLNDEREGYCARCHEWTGGDVRPQPGEHRDGAPPFMTSDHTYTYADRYTALGIPHPDVETMCKGQCEGTGVYPVHNENLEEPHRTLWLAAEAKAPTDDGWHFVICPDCNGTGKAPAAASRHQ